MQSPISSRVAPSVLLVFLAFVSLVSRGYSYTTVSPPPHKPCIVASTCEQCLENVSCLWCNTNSSCLDYPVRHILPPSSLCQLSQARWGVCWVNFEALIIAMAVVGGSILLSITVCCCCCCCCRRGQSGPDRDDERLARRREAIRQKSENRKAERRARHDEIRKKYGLIPDSDHPYSKFEND